MQNEINIVPVKFSNLTTLSRVHLNLQQRFNNFVGLTELNIDIENTYSLGRGQYYSTQLIANSVSPAESIKGKVILLTEADLYIPVLTYIFGEAQLNGKISLVSVCRLHEEFYLRDGNEDLLIERTMKEVLHELGHNFGLKHCDNWDCVMHASPGIEEIDIKGNGYCRKCAVAVPGYKSI